MSTSSSTKALSSEQIETMVAASCNAGNALSDELLGRAVDYEHIIPNSERSVSLHTAWVDISHVLFSCGLSIEELTDELKAHYELHLKNPDSLSPGDGLDRWWSI